MRPKTSLPTLLIQPAVWPNFTTPTATFDSAPPTKRWNVRAVAKGAPSAGVKPTIVSPRVTTSGMSMPPSYSPRRLALRTTSTA